MTRPTTYCCGGGGGQYYADRSRNQLQASLTKFAEKFGSHSFKFGAEIERSQSAEPVPAVRPRGVLHLATTTAPDYRVSYGYDLQGDNRRTSLYAQDQWNAGRATLNLGPAPGSHPRHSPGAGRDVYTPALPGDRASASPTI